jgi:hypothetical protein
MPQIYCYSDEVGLRSVPYGQAMDRIPDLSDDISQGWCDSAFWQYIDQSGAIVMYLCLSASAGNALWKAL